MSDLDDTDYYASRAVKEAELAEAAGDPMVAAIHRAMADSYQKLAIPTNTGRAKLSLVSS